MIRVRELLVCFFNAIEESEFEKLDNSQINSILLKPSLEKKLIYIIKKDNKVLLNYVLIRYSYIYQKKNNCNINKKNLETSCILIIYIIYKYLRNKDSEVLDFILNRRLRSIEEIKKGISLYLY